MKVILVDTFGFFFRSYYALPPLQNSKQFPTSLLTGFATLIFTLYKEQKDSCIIFALEGGGTNRRKEYYKEYKANRKDAPEELLLQLPVAITWLHKMGLPTISLEGYEADDCIASLAVLAKAQGYSVQIMSHDKDLYQLIDDSIHIFDYAKKQEIAQKECFEKFGVLPQDFILYQSIVGDSSDNVPGIKGIGAKGAQKILSHFKSLESLYETIINDYQSIESLLGKRSAGLIKEGKESAFISRELVTLRKDLFQNYDFAGKKNAYTTSPLLAITEELESYELHRVLQKLKPEMRQNSIQNTNTPNQTHTSPTSFVDIVRHTDFIESTPTKHAPQFHYKAHTITDSKELFNLLESIPKGSLVSFDCETNGLEVRHDSMVGFSFCFDGKNGYYVPFLHGGVVRDMSLQKDSKKHDKKDYKNGNLFDYFESESTQNEQFQTESFEGNLFQKSAQQNNNEEKPPTQISQIDAKNALKILFQYKLIGHNIKFDLHITWHNFGIKPKHTPKDSMLLAWLFNPSQSVSLDSLMQQYFSHTMIAFHDIVPKKATFDCIDIESAGQYAAEDAVATYALYHYLQSELESHLLEVAEKIEFPFISTLCAMEECGIAINYSYFQNLKIDFTQKLQHLQQEIYEKAGATFNLNSPKQVAEMLFDTLKLDPKRKIKTGYSTDEQTLLSLRDLHPVVPLLLEYREVFKLFSAYIEPILKLGKKEHRIYTTFMQTGTNTGRLSSKSPNLQNISVRSELGKSIRKGFVSKEGYKLISLDYSQIELRLLAHFSKDSVLLESFHNNEDIHAATARLLFKEDSSKDFSTKRSIAKSINFGLIYGMGARKLAQTLSITQQEAKEYITNYFATFPNVQGFIQAQKDSIIRNGYSQTLLGRKRYFDFFSAKEFMREEYLREGVNTIFQGSAADLIKLSMNAIYARMPELHNGVCALLLQVHDELIFEVQEERAENLGMQIKDIMEHIYTLNVPLVCNLAIGKTWADLK